MAHATLPALIALLFTMTAEPGIAESAAHAAAPPAKLRVRIDLISQPKDLQLRAAGLDLFGARPEGTIEAFVTPQERLFLERDLGYRLTVLSHDIYKDFEARHGFLGNGNLRDYRNYAENLSFLQGIESAYPAIAHLFQIGSSLEGRAIWAMKISDNVMDDEDEPEILYTAIHHSREPVSNETVLQLIEHYATGYGSDPELTDLVDDRELFFVPIVNPDGYVHVDDVDPYWRKNRRGGYGVDLNRNYGYNWGWDNIGSSPYTGDPTYRGSGPFSEPETQAIRDLCETREFVFALNFHTFGEYYLWPWGYITAPTPEQEIFAAHGDSLSRDNGYTAGIGSIVLYITNGDADDWMYGETETKGRIFAITPEIGDDFWPATWKIQGFVDENIAPAVYLAAMAATPAKPVPPRAPVVVAAPVTGDSFRVVWDNRANADYDPPVSYRLDEMVGLNRIEDDLENGGGAWLAADGFELRTNRYESATHSYYSGRSNQNVATLTATQYLGVEPTDEILIWTWYDIETDWDYAYVQVSEDGGQSWANLAGNITTNYNPNGTNLGNGITGSSGGWIEGSFALDSYTDRSVLLRFSYNTDQAVLEEGIYFDDIYPVESFDTVTTLVAATPELFHDISGRAPDSYYYRVNATDADDQTSAWSARAEVQVTDTDLVLTLAPQSTTVPRGGELVYTGSIRNEGPATRSIDGWAELTLPGVTPYPGPVLGPISLTVAPGETVSQEITQAVAPAAPLGTYTYLGAAGAHPTPETSAVFAVTVTE